MALTKDNFREIKERIFNAYKTEDPILQKFRISGAIGVVAL